MWVLFQVLKTQPEGRLEYSLTVDPLFHWLPKRNFATVFFQSNGLWFLRKKAIGCGKHQAILLAFLRVRSGNSFAQWHTILSKYVLLCNSLIAWKRLRRTQPKVRYKSGYEAGYSAGYEAGYDEGYYDGYDEGYYYGYEDGVADTTPEDDGATDDGTTDDGTTNDTVTE